MSKFVEVPIRVYAVGANIPRTNVLLNMAKISAFYPNVESRYDPETRLSSWQIGGTIVNMDGENSFTIDMLYADFAALLDRIERDSQ